MLFVELAAQAVRGFTPSVRVALRPGYVALKSPASLPAPLAGLVSALCFPDGRGGDLVFLAPGAKAGRAGLSIQGKGQSVWRVVRDLGGAGGLHRLNPKTNQYEVVTQDALEVAQVMRTDVGFPGQALDATPPGSPRAPAPHRGARARARLGSRGPGAPVQLRWAPGRAVQHRVAAPGPRGAQGEGGGRP